MINDRLLVGLAGGLSLVTVPIYLSDILPPKQKRLSGTFHQFAIGVGMIVGQSLSIPFDRPFWWRSSLVVGCGIAVVLLISGLGQHEDSKEEVTERGHDEETPLLSENRMLYPWKAETDLEVSAVEPMSVKQLFTCESSQIKRGCKFSSALP